MNEISFVIAPDEFGVGHAEAVEPVIDDISLVDVMAKAEGQRRYAALCPPEMFLERWRTLLEAGEPGQIHLLGCGCGDDWCSHVLAKMSFSGAEVTLSDFFGSHSDPEACERVGPFRFDRARFARALAEPVRAERPVSRDTS